MFTTEFRNPLMLAAFQDVANAGDSVPIARDGGHTEILLDDFMGIHQRRSQPPVDTQGESAGDPYDLHLPRLASRLADGKGRQCPRAFRQNAYEPAHVVAGRLIRKWFPGREVDEIDRKSTRLNSSHVRISYAVFCLKKKTK